MKTIFIKDNTFVNSPTINLIKSLDSILVNSDESIKSNFIFLNEFDFNSCMDYSSRHNLPTNNFVLINKHSASQLYTKYNFSILPTIKPLQLSDVEDFDGNNFFIKPVIGRGGTFFSTMLNINTNPLISQIFYKPISKQSTLEILSIQDINFWNDQEDNNSGFIIQKYADVYENSQINHYIQYGCINGNGTVFFCNPALSSKIKINNIYCSLTSYSSENLSDEILNIQSMIQDLVSGENIKNCLFNMQFLIVNGAYMPIDFNFRLGYQDIYINDQFPELNWGRSLIEYAYDIIDNTPVRPQISTALNLKRTDKLIAHGQTKQEALDNLQNLINNT